MTEKEIRITDFMKRKLERRISSERSLPNCGTESDTPPGRFPQFGEHS